MPTLEELVNKYQNYSDEELFNTYNQIDGYTDTGKEAFKIVVDKRGGIDFLKDKINKQFEILTESSKIKSIVINMLETSMNSTEIIDKIAIINISKNQLEEIVNEAMIEFENEKSDRKIKPRTVIGGIIGGLIGGTIGGIFWGIQMVLSNHIMYIFGIGLALLSYGSIRLFTKQSKKNIVVLVMTIISVIYAISLGQIIYEIFG